jgi:hypothetical protein
VNISTSIIFSSCFPLQVLAALAVTLSLVYPELAEGSKGSCGLFATIRQPFRSPEYLKLSGIFQDNINLGMSGEDTRQEEGTSSNQQPKQGNKIAILKFCILATIIIFFRKNK